MTKGNNNNTQKNKAKNSQQQQTFDNDHQDNTNNNNNNMMMMNGGGGKNQQQQQQQKKGKKDPPQKNGGAGGKKQPKDSTKDRKAAKSIAVSESVAEVLSLAKNKQTINSLNNLFSSWKKVRAITKDQLLGLSYLFHCVSQQLRRSDNDRKKPKRRERNSGDNEQTESLNSTLQQILNDLEDDVEGIALPGTSNSFLAELFLPTLSSKGAPKFSPSVIFSIFAVVLNHFYANRNRHFEGQNLADQLQCVETVGPLINQFFVSSTHFAQMFSLSCVPSANIRMLSENNMDYSFYDSLTIDQAKEEVNTMEASHPWFCRGGRLVSKDQSAGHTLKDNNYTFTPSANSFPDPTFIRRNLRPAENDLAGWRDLAKAMAKRYKLVQDLYNWYETASQSIEDFCIANYRKNKKSRDQSSTTSSRKSAGAAIGDAAYNKLAKQLEQMHNASALQNAQIIALQQQLIAVTSSLSFISHDVLFAALRANAILSTQCTKKQVERADNDAAESTQQLINQKVADISIVRDSTGGPIFVTRDQPLTGLPFSVFGISDTNRSMVLKSLSSAAHDEAATVRALFSAQQNQNQQEDDYDDDENNKGKKQDDDDDDNDDENSGGDDDDGDDDDDDDGVDDSQQHDFSL